MDSKNKIRNIIIYFITIFPLSISIFILYKYTDTIFNSIFNLSSNLSLYLE